MEGKASLMSKPCATRRTPRCNPRGCLESFFLAAAGGEAPPGAGPCGGSTWSRPAPPPEVGQWPASTSKSALDPGGFLDKICQEEKPSHTATVEAGPGFCRGANLTCTQARSKAGIRSLEEGWVHSPLQLDGFVSGACLLWCMWVQASPEG